MRRCNEASRYCVKTAALSTVCKSVNEKRASICGFCAVLVLVFGARKRRHEAKKANQMRKRTNRLGGNARTGNGWKIYPNVGSKCHISAIKTSNNIPCRVVSSAGTRRHNLRGTRDTQMSRGSAVHRHCHCHCSCCCHCHWHHCCCQCRCHWHPVCCHCHWHPPRHRRPRRWRRRPTAPIRSVAADRVR